MGSQIGHQWGEVHRLVLVFVFPNIKYQYLDFCSLKKIDFLCAAVGINTANFPIALSLLHSGKNNGCLKLLNEIICKKLASCSFSLTTAKQQLQSSAKVIWPCPIHAVKFYYPLYNWKLLSSICSFNQYCSTSGWSIGSMIGIWIRQIVLFPGYLNTFLFLRMLLLRSSHTQRSEWSNRPDPFTLWDLNLITCGKRMTFRSWVT